MENEDESTAIAVSLVGGVIMVVGLVVWLSNVNHVEVGDRYVAKRRPAIAFTPGGFVF